MEPTCNVFNSKCELHIPEGHERCFQCGGRGCHIVAVHFKQRHIVVGKCPTCDGTGITDWITSARKKSMRIGYFSEQSRLNLKCGGSKGCKVIKRWARNKMSEREPTEMYQETFFKRKR